MVSSPCAGVKPTAYGEFPTVKCQFPAGGDEAMVDSIVEQALESVPRGRKSDRPVSFPCAGVKLTETAMRSLQFSQFPVRGGEAGVPLTCASNLRSVPRRRG